MKRLIVLILVGAMACLAFATENSKPVADASSLPLGVKAVGPAIVETASPTLSSEMTLEEVASFEALKTRYYDLLNRAVLGMATAAELTELNDLSATMGWEAFSEEVRGEEGSLDQGSADTLSNCASATVIPSVPYSDSGLLDGDNDCSVVSASPSNEVFYTFTPTVSGSYFIRAARTGTTAAVAAVRVMSGGCCAGASSVAFSSGTVATDCGELASRVTYLRADLVAGTQYWLHVGSSSATVSTESYDFSIVKSPDCPVDESAVAHSTCATAQFLAIGDSVIADSASDAVGHDWYQIELAQGDSIRIDVYGRAAGSCLSGSYPGISGAFVDARFSFWSSCSGLAADSLGGDDLGTHGIVTCSEDAAQAFCLNPGIYYIKVRNFGVQQYIIKTTSLGPCTTAPVACETLSPCGSPAEIEPNGTCADAANILSLECTGGPYYGVLCPGTERDYWYVPATTGTMQTTVLLADGPNCSTFPPTILGLRVATTAAGLCTTPSGSFAGGFVFGGCFPWPGGWIAVDRAITAGQSTYSLSVSCADFRCPCPVSQDPNVGQECVSCLGEFPEPGNLAGSVSFFQTVVPQYQIVDLDVCVAITHTFTGDIDLFLVTPWSDTLELSTDNGSTGDNMYVTTFDDEATTLITAGTAPFNGSYIPEELLAGVDGNNAAGTWELICGDDAGGDSGYVHCWCLNFTYDVILSVELASFTAVAGDGNVTLNWATASESDNDHFTVERNGETMANVEATNNSSGSNYTWTDNTVVNGTPYEYSLYAVDANGARELLGTVAATPESDGSVVTEYALMQNYPNPFNPTTNIAFDMVEAGNVSISIFNVMGQKVAEIVNGNVAAGRHVVSFDATGLSSGLYLYKMEANGFTAQAKMVLMK